jgi:hypothetical protein
MPRVTVLLNTYCTYCIFLLILAAGGIYKEHTNQ